MNLASSIAAFFLSPNWLVSNLISNPIAFLAWSFLCFAAGFASRDPLKDRLAASKARREWRKLPDDENAVFAMAYDVRSSGRVFSVPQGTRGEDTCVYLAKAGALEFLTVINQRNEPASTYMVSEPWRRFADKHPSEVLAYVPRGAKRFR